MAMLEGSTGPGGVKVLRGHEGLKYQEDMRGYGINRT